MDLPYSPSITAPAPPDALLNLPQPSRGVEILCISMYVVLGGLSVFRIVHQGWAVMEGKKLFQLVMALFAVVRVSSFVVTRPWYARDILNRLSVCLLSTVILFQVLFWIDIVNPKISKRSKRLWHAFLVINAVFYSVVFFLELVPHIRSKQSFLFDVLPVLMIALGSFAASIGLLYSICKMHQRVLRILTTSSIDLNMDFDMQRNLHRALQFLKGVMIVCSVTFLLRTFLYIQKPFSHKECGQIKDPNLCIIVGYLLPEWIPCILLLFLMWEVDPNIWRSRRQWSTWMDDGVGLGGNPADISSTLPTFLSPSGSEPVEKLPLLVKTATESSLPGPGVGPMSTYPYLLSSSFSSVGSSALLNSYSSLSMKSCYTPPSMEHASFEYPPSQDGEWAQLGATFPKIMRARSSHDHDVEEKSERLKSSVRSPLGRRTRIPLHPSQEPIQKYFWFSFDCFDLEFPPGCQTSFIVVYRIQFDASERKMVEIGRTEEISGQNPHFQVMVPIPIPSFSSRDCDYQVTVIAVPTNDSLPQQKTGHWDQYAAFCIGETQFKPSSFIPRGSCLSVPLRSSTLDVQGTSGATTEPQRVTDTVPGEEKHVLRCVVQGRDVRDSESKGDTPHEAVGRSVIVLRNEKPFSATLSSLPNANPVPHPMAMLRGFCVLTGNGRRVVVEEECIECTLGWEVPYQMLQLYLSTLSRQLEALEQDVRGDGDKKSANANANANAPGSAQSMSSFSDPEKEEPRSSASALNEMIHHIRNDANDRKYVKWRLNLMQKIKDYIAEVEILMKLYRKGSYDGKTFKPSTMKASLELRFLPTNLHAQYMHVTDMNEHTPYGEEKSRRSYGPHKKRRTSRYTGTDHVERGSEQENMRRKQRRGIATNFSSSAEHETTSATVRCEIYGLVTVGAFAAHAYGFKKGGVRQMQEKCARLEDAFEKEYANSLEEDHVQGNLTLEAIEREYYELHWTLHRRLGVVFTQAITSLVASFTQTLLVGLVGRDPRGFLDQIFSIGFLFSVESLLSTYGNEVGMLGDMDGAMKELAKVKIVLAPVRSALAAGHKVRLVSSASTGWVVELPVVLVGEGRDPSPAAFRVSARSGVLLCSEQIFPSELAQTRSIDVVPVLFTQGLNEMQTVANTVGRNLLQKEINLENIRGLRTYFESFATFMATHPSVLTGQSKSKPSLLRSITSKILPSNDKTGAFDDKGSVWEDTLEAKRAVLASIEAKINAQSYREKCMEILSQSSEIVRFLRGGRVTCCKSAKDRTGMSVTLEESEILQQHHGISASDRASVTSVLRSHGVRRENARKNIGKPQYCFSTIQNYLLPEAYQCPKGTGGGSSSES